MNGSGEWLAGMPKIPVDTVCRPVRQFSGRQERRQNDSGESKMARVKIDLAKVTMAGATELPELVAGLPEGIKALAEKGAIKTKVGLVTLNVASSTEGEAPKQFGAKYLKIDSADDSSVDSILAAIKNAGKVAVIDSYNALQRDSRLSYLSGAFGDVSKAIDEAVAVCIEKMGMTQDEAREFVIARRTKAGMRVA